MKSPPPLSHYDAKTVGALVRHMRKEASLTREGLGAKIDLHGGSVTRIERGTHTISLEKLMLVAKVCGFSIRLSIDSKVK